MKATAAERTPPAKHISADFILGRCKLGLREAKLPRYASIATAAPPLISSRAFNASIERAIRPLNVSCMCHSQGPCLIFGLLKEGGRHWLRAALRPNIIYRNHRRSSRTEAQLLLPAVERRQGYAKRFQDATGVRATLVLGLDRSQSAQPRLARNCFPASNAAFAHSPSLVRHRTIGFPLTLPSKS